MLGLKGQPADNQHLLHAPALLPVSMTGPTHPPVNLDHFSIFAVHPVNGRAVCSPCLFLWSVLSLLFILAVSILLPSELWLTFIVHPTLRMIFLKGRSDSVTPLLKTLQWLLTALLA